MTQCVGEFYEVPPRFDFEYRPREPAGVRCARWEQESMRAHAVTSGIEFADMLLSASCRETGCWISQRTGEEVWEEMEDCDEECED